MSDDHRERAARTPTPRGGGGSSERGTWGRVLFGVALLAAGSHLVEADAAPLRLAGTAVCALTLLTWCLGPVAVLVSGRAGSAIDGGAGSDVRVARLAVALVLAPPLFAVVVVLLRALGLELGHAVGVAFALCGAGHLVRGRSRRALTGSDVASSDSVNGASVNCDPVNGGPVSGDEPTVDSATGLDTPRSSTLAREAPGPAPDGSRVGWTMAAAVSLALLLAVVAASPWFGAGPLGAGPLGAGSPGAGSLGAGLSDSGPPASGALDAELATRFARAAAATSEVRFDDPTLANAAPLANRARAHLEGVIGSALHLGPFAATAFATAWGVFALGLAGALFVARRAGSSRARIASAPLVAVFGAVAAGSFAAPVADPLLRAARSDGFAPVLALVVTGLWAWRDGAAPGRDARGWRQLSAVALGLAFVLDAWVGALGLAIAAVASARGPHAVDRLLALVLAALPALALPLVGWPVPTTAPGGFVVIGPILVLAVVANAFRRGPGASGSAIRTAAQGDELRLVAATLVFGSLAASWAGGGAALAALLAAGTVAALALVVAWPRAQWVLVALCAFASLGPARNALEAAGTTSLLVDEGPSRLGVRLDAPEVVRAAWDGEPGPAIFDPRWKEPLESQTKDAADWATLWATLRDDAALRALDPVLLVEPGVPGPRYAGGGSLALAHGMPPEGALLANLDLFVVEDSHTRPVPPDLPSAARRLETVAALLGDDGVVIGMHRRRLEALARPFVIPVGPQQRARVRGLDQRLVQFGCVELARYGDVALYGWPARSFDALASD